MSCHWSKRAEREYNKVVEYIINEFGKKEAVEFVLGVREYEDRLSKYPEMGAPEPLLRNRKNKVYHSYIVSKHNKIIYTIDKQRNVNIVDMWDMRREPHNLSKRIKTK